MLTVAVRSVRKKMLSTIFLRWFLYESQMLECNE